MGNRFRRPVYVPIRQTSIRISLRLVSPESFMRAIGPPFSNPRTRVFPPVRKVFAVAKLAMQPLLHSVGLV